MLSKLKNLTFLTAFCCALAACGGGDGDNSSSAGSGTITAPPALTYSIAGSISGPSSLPDTVIMRVEASGYGIHDTTLPVNATSGSYLLPSLANGNYTLTPRKAGFSFTPVSQVVNISGANASRVNFTATPDTPPVYGLSGNISGPAIANVLLTLSGASTGSVLSDSHGNFSFTNLSTSGDYTVTPSLPGYSFTPANLTASIYGSNVAIGSFVATALPIPTYNLTGRVSGDIQSGISLNLTGAATKTTTTASDGRFSFTGLHNGSYTLTPVLSGYAFSPASTAVTINNSSAVSDFVATAVAPAPTYSLSGTITGEVVNNVKVILKKSKTPDGTGTYTEIANTYSNSSGNYSFSGLANGYYQITPTLSGYTFLPGRVVAITDKNVTNANFTSKISQYYLTVLGKVTVSEANRGFVIACGGGTVGTAPFDVMDSTGNLITTTILNDTDTPWAGSTHGPGGSEYFRFILPIPQSPPAGYISVEIRANDPCYSFNPTSISRTYYYTQQDFYANDEISLNFKVIGSNNQ